MIGTHQVGSERAQLDELLREIDRIHRDVLLYLDHSLLRKKGCVPNGLHANRSFVLEMVFLAKIHQLQAVYVVIYHVEREQKTERQVFSFFET